MVHLRFSSELRTLVLPGVV